MKKTSRLLKTCLTLLLICGSGVAWGEELDEDRDREGFVNEYELMQIIADSDFACGLPNCKIRKKHLFEKGTLTQKETRLLRELYPKNNWHFEFDRDISKCRGCKLIEVVCSGYDYYKAVPKGTSKDGIMFYWFFDFEDNYLLERMWELETRIKELEAKYEGYKCEGCGTTNYKSHMYDCLVWRNLMFSQ